MLRTFAFSLAQYKIKKLFQTLSVMLKNVRGERSHKNSKIHHKLENAMRARLWIHHYYFSISTFLIR